MLEVVDYLNANAPANATVQTTNIGIIGYYTDLQILEPLGLASPEVTPLFAGAGSTDQLLLLVAQTLEPDFIVSFGEAPYQDYDQIAAFPTSTVTLIIYQRSLPQ